jgi:hypothetical protein
MGRSATRAAPSLIWVVVAATLVGNWFLLCRGLVQGMVGSAGAPGEMLVVPLNLFLERDYGWQHMYRSMGTVLLLGVLPCIWAVVRNRPEDIGLHPYGTTAPREPRRPGPVVPPTGSPFGRLARSRRPGSSSISALPEDRRWASCESISFRTSVSWGFPI